MPECPSLPGIRPQMDHGSSVSFTILFCQLPGKRVCNNLQITGLLAILGTHLPHVKYLDFIHLILLKYLNGIRLPLAPIPHQAGERIRNARREQTEGLGEWANAAGLTFPDNVVCAAVECEEPKRTNVRGCRDAQQRSSRLAFSGGNRADSRGQ